MKKKYLLFPLIVLSSASVLGGLSSCNKDKTLTKSPVIISEYVEGSTYDHAIELANVSKKSVNLSEYKLSVYVNESRSKEYELDGTLEPNKTYVVVSNSSSDELKAKANKLCSIDFMGKQPIRLTKKGKVVDCVGENNTNLNEFGKDVTLVRKTNYMNGRSTWDEYEWLRYLVDTNEYLGNLNNSVTEEELLAGPKLTEEDLALPFFDGDTSNGAGGVIDVTLKYGVDGDTSVFNYPTEIYTKLKGINSSFSGKVRYQNIDTPESYQGNIAEFGIPAKLYTTSVLENATKIQLQSIKGGQILETFGRLLAWVWEDDNLLNFEIVKKGYSEVAFSDIDTMSYKGITYTNYLYNISLYAARNKLGIWGEKDPYWDYNTNKSTYTGETKKPEDYND